MSLLRSAVRRSAFLNTRGVFAPNALCYSNSVFSNKSSSRFFCSSKESNTDAGADATNEKQATDKAEAKKEVLYTCKYTGKEFYSTDDILRYQGMLTRDSNGEDVLSIPVYTKPLVDPRKRSNAEWLKARDEHSKKFGLTPIDFSKHIYQLQIEDPVKWTDAALSDKYHLPVEKISAIIRMREHAEKWEKENPVPDDCNLDVLARSVFGELDLKLLHERHLELMRRPPQGDSANFMFLGEKEPDFEEQRAKWKKEGRLSVDNPYLQRNQVDRSAVSVGLTERLEQEEATKYKNAKKFVVTEV